MSIISTVSEQQNMLILCPIFNLKMLSSMYLVTYWEFLRYYMEFNKKGKRFAFNHFFYKPFDSLKSTKCIIKIPVK